MYLSSQEGMKAVVGLTHDEPGVVAQLVHWLYYNTYEDRTLPAALPVPPTASVTMAAFQRGKAARRPTPGVKQSLQLSISSKRSTGGALVFNVK